MCYQGEETRSCGDTNADWAGDVDEGNLPQDMLLLLNEVVIS